MITEEFYNKVHKKADGKFADTPGPGNAKGARPKTASEKAAHAKLMAKPKTKAGSVVVSETAAKPATKKAAPAPKPKPKPAASKPAAKKPAPAPAKPEPKKPAAKKDTPEPKKVTVKKELVDKVKAKGSANDDINKPLADLSDAAIDKLSVQLMKGKDASKDYELHGPKDDPDAPYGYIINYNTDHFYDMKKGQTVQQGIDAMNKKETNVKVPKPKPVPKVVESADDTPEGRRIAKILGTRTNRLVPSKTVADNDEIGRGRAMGMNETPPPIGVKAAKLSDDHIAALGEYRGNAFKAINTTLRIGKPTSGSQSPTAIKVWEVVADLDGAFKAAPLTAKDIVVYRGTKKGLPNSFTDRAFTSTSYSMDIAKEFGELIKIVIPKGTPVLKMSGGFSEKHYQGESELLLPRNSTYVIQPDGSYKVTTPK